MALNPNIVLGANGLDVVGAVRAGAEAGAQMREFARQNALAQVFQQYGPAMVQGDQGAINQLAMQDPAAAMNIQATQLDMQRARQNMAFGAEEMQMKRNEVRAQAAQQAAKMSAEQRAAEAAKAEQLLKGAGYFHAQGDRAGYENFVRQNGGDPAQFPFDQFPAIAGMAGDVLDVYQKYKPEPQKPMTEFAKINADLNANLITPEQAQQAMAGAGPRVDRLTLPDGTMMENGALAGGGGNDKQVFDAMVGDRDIARRAASGYRALVEAKKAVDDGIVSGFGADTMLAARKAVSLMGIGDPKTIENTETFRAAIAPQVAAMLRDVAGNNQFSNADREFAQNAAGGSITLDSKSISRLIGTMEKGNRLILEQYQKRLDSVYPDNPKFARDRAFLAVEMPQFMDAGATAANPSTFQAPSGNVGGINWKVVQ